MASTVYKNKRRADALERMNIALARLSAKHDIPLLEIPKKIRDKELREILVFETVANVLESVLGSDAPMLEHHPLVMKQANRGISEAPYKQGNAVLSGPKVSNIDSTPVRQRKVAAPRKPKPQADTAKAPRGKKPKNGG